MKAISILLENEPGALSRVVGLFSQRGYNIQTLTVAPTEDISLSRLTITTTDDANKMEKIVKHLGRLVDVVKLADLSLCDYFAVELILIKVQASKLSNYPTCNSLCRFGAKIVSMQDDIFIIQMACNLEEFEIFAAHIGRDSIVEIARSGVTGIQKTETLVA